MFNAEHLRRILAKYATYYNEVRTHVSLGKDRKRSPPTTRRRALELLAAFSDGCTEAIMLAHGFTVEQMVELVRAGLATARTERVRASGLR